MYGSSCCDCAILLPFSLGQLIAITSLEKGRAVAHRFVSYDLTSRKLEARLVAALTMRADG